MGNSHVLVSLNDDLSIGKIAQPIKGESSHWINQLQLTADKFEWQDEYLAIGAGDDKLTSYEIISRNNPLCSETALII